MSVCVCVCVVLRSLIQSATCRDYRLQMYTQYSSHQHQQQPSTTLPVHAADTPASTGGSGGGLSSADGGKRRASVGGDRLSSAETVGGSGGDSGTSSAKRPRCHDDEQSAAAAALQSVQHTHTHSPLTALYPGLSRCAGTSPVPIQPGFCFIQYQSNLDFAEARDSEWRWHQLGHNMQVCISLQTDNHASTPPPTPLEVAVKHEYFACICFSAI